MAKIGLTSARISRFLPVSNLENAWRKKNFSKDEIIAPTNANFDHLDKSEYLEGSYNWRNVG